ncbi:hypothetical protein BDZ97DRAFT_1914351 [Flammula alnicola]|nr:hypothetical protein BDZ97DRAFT_1914351 [Flammula alnicola]
MNVEHIEAAQLSSILKHYEDTTAKFEAKLMALDKEIDAVQADISLEKASNIGFYADQAGESEIVLIYVVGFATWTATYVRVSTQSKESPVQISYKASIMQSTGEGRDLSSNFSELPDL